MKRRFFTLSHLILTSFILAGLNLGCSVSLRDDLATTLQFSTTTLSTSVNSNANSSKILDLSSLITTQNGDVTYSLSGSGSITTAGVYSPPTSGGATSATVTVTDLTPSTQTINITVNAILSSVNASFNGITNYNVAGSSLFQDGVTPYSYSVTAGATIDSSTGVFTTATAGSYTITVTDAVGDTATTTANIYDPTLDLAFNTFKLDSSGTHTGLAHTRGDASTIATYVDNSGVLQTVAANSDLRFTYDPSACATPTDTVPTCTTTPTGRRPLGPLIEDSRTNLVLRSEELDNASWTVSEVTTSANTGVVTDPKGTNLAEKIVESTNNATHFLYQDMTITAGEMLSASVFVQSAERTQLRLTLCDTTCTDGVHADFNLSSPSKAVAVSGTGSRAQAQMLNFQNGWFRLSLNGIINSSATTARMRIELKDGSGNLTYTGDGASGLYAFGAQLEQAPWISSYIATAGTTVTRAADVVTFASAIAGGQNVNMTRDQRLDPTGANTATSNAIASYIDIYGQTRFAAANEPRFTYYPQTCADDSSALDAANIYCARKARGFLSEQSSTNLVTDGLDLLSWTASGTITFENSSNFGPDGITSATTVTKSVVTNVDLVKTVTVANDSATYTASVFVKRVASPTYYPRLNLCFSGGTDVCYGVILQTSTGTSAADSSTSTGSSDHGVEHAGDYFRVWVRGANNASGNTSLELRVNPAASTTFGTFTTIATGSNDFWGAQVESGNRLSSYIYAGASTAQRQGDNANVTNTTGWYSATDSTLYSKFALSSTYSTSSQYTAAELSDGTAAETAYLGSESNTDGYIASVTDASTIQGSNQTTTLSTSDIISALSFTSNRFNSAHNGTLGTADTTVAVPTMDRLSLGNSNGSSQVHGVVERIFYLNQQVDDAVLTGITTP